MGTSLVLLMRRPKNGHPPLNRQRLLGREGFNLKGQVQRGPFRPRNQARAPLGIYPSTLAVLPVNQFPALDHLFNVQVIKGRYTIDSDFVMSDGPPSTIQLKASGAPACRRAASPNRRNSSSESHLADAKTLQRRAVSPVSASTCRRWPQKNRRRSGGQGRRREGGQTRRKLPMHPYLEKTTIENQIMNAELNASGEKEVVAGSERGVHAKRSHSLGDLYAVEDFDDEFSHHQPASRTSSADVRSCSPARQRTRPAGFDDLRHRLRRSRARQQRADDELQETRQTVSQLAHLFVSIVNQRDL